MGIRHQHETRGRPVCAFCFSRPRSGVTPAGFGVSYSDYYAEQGLFRRLMDRLRAIALDEQRFRPVLATALRE
jgi:hypothetical protein